MTARALVPVVVLALAAAACAPRRPAPPAPEGGVLIVYPPEVEEATAPNGRRLLPRAPLAEWRPGRAFASAEACEAWRAEDLSQAIRAARAALGDEAKNDLGVRRAVNARCVAR